MAASSIVELDDYAAFCRGGMPNLYEFFHRLRAEDPVHWSPRLSSWVLTRYVDVAKALSDPRLSAKRIDFYMDSLPEELRERHASVGEHIKRFFVHLDPPEHTALRRKVGKAFTPKLINELRPNIEQMVDKLLDAVEPQGRMDIVEDFACPLPALIICEMLGVPEPDRLRFGQWSRDVTGFLGASRVTLPERIAIAQESLDKLTEYFKGLIAERRREPQNDLISMLIGIEEEGDLLSEHDLIIMCDFLLVAGHDTTTNLLSNGALALLKFPVEFERLKADPSLINPAVEEFLRWEAPLQRQTRVALEDFEIDGHLIRKGQSVLSMQGAANHDPAQFADPDTVDITRKDNRHLSFGAGIHYCMGAPLARLEGQIAFNALARRMPNMRLAGGPIEWRENVTFRSLKALPVVF